jgi:hypothetical protein
MKVFLFALLALFFLVAGQQLLCSDDGCFPGQGDSVIPMTHTEDEMVREVVKIDRNFHVRCDFWFKNTGAAADVQMGFPESLGEMGEPGIRNFQTLVDGKKVEAVRKEGAVNPSLPKMTFEAVYIWTTHFEKGQSRHIANQYDFSPSTGNFSHVSGNFPNKNVDAGDMYYEDTIGSCRFRACLYSSPTRLAGFEPMCPSLIARFRSFPR